MKKEIFALSLAIVVSAQATPQVEFGPAQQAPFRVLSSVNVGSTGAFPRGVFLKDSFAVVAVNNPSNTSSQIVAIDTSDPMAMTVEAGRAFTNGMWSEPFVANGNVYTGFRFGSPKVTTLIRQGDEFSFGQTSALETPGTTLYHWRGWGRVEQLSLGRPEAYIVMSDALTSASQGGLYIYDESGQLVGFQQGQVSGEDIVIHSDGQWCFQIDNGDRSSGMGAEAQSIRTWSISDVTQPTLVGTTSTEAFAGSGTRARDLVLDASENYLFVSCGEYGFRVADVSDPANPQFIPGATRYGLNQPDKQVRGLVLYQPDVLAVTATEGGVSRVTLWDIIDPTSPRRLGDVTPEGVTSVTDLDVRLGRVYATVVTGGIPQLQIWH